METRTAAAFKARLEGRLGKALRLALPILLCIHPPVAAQDADLPAETATESPSLTLDTAIYHMDGGTLQYAFTFVNPTDSVVFLDCQVPPFAALAGNTLVLTFDRASLAAPAGESPEFPVTPSKGGGGGHGVSSSGAGKPKPPQRSASAGLLAGGPLHGGAVNAGDFPPQRVGPHQAFQGQRKLDRVLGDPHARPAFAKVQVSMSWYPGRPEGEGEPYLVERKAAVDARAKNVVRKGKAPPPPKIRKFRAPRETPG